MEMQPRGMQSKFEVNHAAHLDQLLALFAERKGENTIWILSLKIKSTFCCHQTAKLWQVLSHSNSNITRLELIEDEPDALIGSLVARVVKRWCEEVPTKVQDKRTLILRLNEYNTQKTREAFTDLRGALETPRNGVTDVEIAFSSSAVGACRLLLQPVLQNPNNEVAKLTLEYVDYFSDKEAKALSLGLCSENCKVKSFEVMHVHLTPIGSLALLESLYDQQHLEELRWTGNNPNWTEADITLFVNCLSKLLERPMNRLRSLSLTMRAWQQNDVLILTKALMNEHCQVVGIACDLHGIKEHAPNQLFDAFRHSNNRLRSLVIDELPIPAAGAVKVALKDENCKLRNLCIRCSPEKVTKAIASALTSRHLQTLFLGTVTSAVLRALTKSFLSRDNRITRLHLDCVDMRYLTTWPEFCQAVRISNVVFVSPSLCPFFKAFNSPFFCVLHTLLSVRSTPRLGRNAWVRLLPFQDYIFSIADTLDWPLDDLRLNRN